MINHLLINTKLYYIDYYLVLCLNIVMIEAPGAPAYIDSEIKFGYLSDSRAPVLTAELEDGAEIAIPAYLVAPEAIELNVFNKANRDSLTRTRTVLGRIMCHAQDIRAVDFVPDREALIAEATGDINQHDFLMIFGIYTSLVRNNGEMITEAMTAPTNIVHRGVRDDLISLFTVAETMYKAMEPNEQSVFLDRLVDNYAHHSGGSRSIRSRGWASRWNGAIFTIRNATMDILRDSDSVIDPASQMVTRILRRLVIEPRTTREEGLGKVFTTYLKDPEILVANPELLFILDQYLSAKNEISRRDAERLSDGLIVSLIGRIHRSETTDEYTKRLADAYLAIADKSVEDRQRANAFTTKASEGGYHDVASVVVSLASSVARANNENRTFTTQKYSASFDYLLDQFDIDNLWPDLEPATVQTFKTAFSKVVHLSDKL